MAVSSYVQLPCCVKKQISLELASALALVIFPPHLLQWSLSPGGVRVDIIVHIGPTTHGHLFSAS